MYFGREAPPSIERLKARLVESADPTIRLGRYPAIEDHVEMLRKEFVGLPELCLAHAELVVRLRRGQTDYVEPFMAMWAGEHDFLCRHLDSRWLISACDTYADYGNDLQRGSAIAIVALINAARIAETEIGLVRDPSQDPERAREFIANFKGGRRVTIWDGITVYHFGKGDMPKNMFERMLRISEPDPAIHTITQTLILRAVENGPNLLARSAARNPDFLPERLRSRLKGSED